MGIDYWIHIDEKNSLLAKILFAMLLMELHGLDFKKFIKPPKELIEWCKGEMDERQKD